MNGSKKVQVISYIGRTLILVFFLIISFNAAMSREGWQWMWIVVVVWVFFLVADAVKTLPRLTRRKNKASKR
ncbi:hypothetical protein [Trueperella bialowiezensis]|uniref:Uncharacterized protein n=1 Tax=Trueperella bialowiezensis TaxID=312285 RepID=A0A3S4V9M5_9ACTO|nr:hypothetical protein [Trueperella bialowiezensis]VEI12653.1 Uncharacterised protein [Trueperella bialowiezensis]